MAHSSHRPRKLNQAAVFWCCGLALILGCFAVLHELPSLKRHDVRQIPAPASKALTTYLADAALPAPDPSSPKIPTRPLFPNSVIPGGVENIQELRSAIARDPLVARHYADFDLSKARVIRLGDVRRA